ncbi:hypothetical protein UPYG_G00249620 [Umbra pygmaea]|uniref:Tetraspanin n=1 Tax=Umbra pygmaea TaxID=75934 RepID=A0ABD0W7A9_UMBPY
MAVNKCIKYLLFLFNLVFWICGCIILGVSIYLKVSKSSGVLGSAVPFVNLMIAIGAIIMVLGFLGCCGAIKENRCMLMLFFIGLLIIFLLLLAAGILGAVKGKNSKDELTQILTPLIPLSKQPIDVQTEIQGLESQAKCCGLINGPADWGNVASQNCSCVDTTQKCTMYGGQNVYSTPCIEALTLLVQSVSLIALGVAFAVAVVMLFGMAFSMTLYCQIGGVTSGV